VPYYDLIMINSDINGDGEGLTLSDFVYLIKIMLGEDSPSCPKNLMVKNYRYFIGNNIFAVDGELGALYVEFDRVTDVELLSSDMDMRRNTDRVVVYSFVGDSFIGYILRFDAEIIKIEAVTPEGDPVILHKFLY